MIEIQDEFLSEEDLDLRHLSWEELVAYWNLWLQQAQASNDLDAAEYSHGVFERDPAVAAKPGPAPSKKPGSSAPRAPSRRPQRV